MEKKNISFALVKHTNQTPPWWI